MEMRKIFLSSAINHNIATMSTKNRKRQFCYIWSNHGTMYEKSNCVKWFWVALSAITLAVSRQKYEVSLLLLMTMWLRGTWKMELRKIILSSAINHNIGPSSTKIRSVFSVKGDHVMENIWKIELREIILSSATNHNIGPRSTKKWNVFFVSDALVMAKCMKNGIT